MASYLGSALEATHPATRRERRFAKHALAKNYRNMPREKLAMFVSMSAPNDVEKNAEVIAKLMRELMTELMKEYHDNDEGYLQRASEFLVSLEGKAWVKSWFLPHEIATTLNEASSRAIVAGSERVALERERFSPNGTGSVLQRGSQSQVIQVPAAHARNDRIAASVRTPCALIPPPFTAVASPTTGEVSAVNQHKRSRSDPGLHSLRPVVFLCPVCHSFHCVMS